MAQTPSVRRSPLLVPGLVFVLALAARLGITAASSGGFTGTTGYDPGVYYAAADSLLAGRIPYRDFLLLHPPALMLALTPFAALGRATSDHTGLMVADAAWSVLGALTAALVAAIAQRMRWSRQGAVAGGAFYAVWFGTASVDVSARLEPLGNLTFVAALFLLTGRSRRARFVAGLLLGVTVSVKIWWIVPVLVVLVAQFLRRDGRPGRTRGALAALGGAVLGALVVDGPFFGLAPGAMWRMVVEDQLLRPTTSTSRLVRITDMVALDYFLRRHDRHAELLVAAVCVVLGLLLVLAARRARGGWLVIAILLSQVAVLEAAPTYFSYYSDFAAAGLALLVAASAHGVAGRRTARGRRLPGRPLAWTAVLAAAAVTCAVLVGPGANVATPFPRQLSASVVHLRCFYSDTDAALIELDALTRDLDHGCPVHVDVSGETYDQDAPPANHPHVKRTQNVRWQHAIRAYLLSGDGFMEARLLTGLSPATKAYLARRSTVIATARRLSVRVVRHGS